MTFKEILDSKMHEKEASEVKTPIVESFVIHDFSDISKFDIEQKLWSKEFKKSSYPKNALPKTKPHSEAKKSKITISEPVVAISELSSEEVIALELLKKYDSQAFQSELISLSQLKKCFRKLAMKYHPDMNAEAPKDILLGIQDSKRILEKRLHQKVNSKNNQEAA